MVIPVYDMVLFFLFFTYDFQVDVWALGVSAIEMAEVYPLLMFLFLWLPSKLLVYPMRVSSLLFLSPLLLPTSFQIFAID